MLTGHPLSLTIILWIIILFVAFLFNAFVLQRIVKYYFHFPISALAARYIDNPFRRLVQPPKKIVDWMDIRDGMQVLEIGPGPGHSHLRLPALSASREGWLLLIYNLA